MSKRVLVTGGAGFIGSHLVDYLLERGDEVVVADNFLTGRYVNLTHVERHDRLRIVYQNMIDRSEHEALRGPFDRVYNLASPASPRGYGRYPIETQHVNSFGIVHALELARRSGARFLQTSTSEVYGEPLVHPQPETYWGNVNPNGPRSCYDEGKRFAESLTMEFAQRFSTDVRIARIFNTYGPRSNPTDGRVVPTFCVQALRGEPISIYGDGTQTRSFCYIDDLVRGLHLLMETDGLSGEVVNLGNPEERTVADLASTIIELSGSNASINFHPLPVDDPTRRCPDITKAQQLLGWQPEVSLRDGLTETLAYFASALGLRLVALAQQQADGPSVAVGG
jgi:nucleoside-diphosphate-sugar epimerase